MLYLADVAAGVFFVAGTKAAVVPCLSQSASTTCGYMHSLLGSTANRYG